MLMLFCPCGHSAPYPEDSGSYRCTKCRRSVSVTWFEGPNAFEKWERWAKHPSRLFGPVGESGRVEYVGTQGTGSPVNPSRSDDSSRESGVRNL